MRSQSVDEVLGALADERRRLVLRYLSTDAGGTASVRDVAEYVASRAGDPIRDVTIYLQHAGLPLLAERGFLEYDPVDDAVRYREHPLVEVVLNSVEET
jgi:hypothetical protein